MNKLTKVRIDDGVRTRNIRASIKVFHSLCNESPSICILQLNTIKCTYGSKMVS